LVERAAQSIRYRFRVVSSRAVRVAGLVVGAAALVLALAPFRTGVTLHDEAGAYPTFARSCGPSVVEATRTPPHDAGWFGYVPVASTAVLGAPGACHEAAKPRLAWSAVGLLVAALLGWWSARLDRGDRRSRRHRWRPHPA
jgi:hypothetical protein